METTWRHRATITRFILSSLCHWINSLSINSSVQTEIIYLYKISPAQCEKLEMGGTKPPLTSRWCVLLYLNIQTSLTKFFGLMHFKTERWDRMKEVRLRRIPPLTLLLLMLVIYTYSTVCFLVSLQKNKYLDCKTDNYVRPCLTQGRAFKSYDQYNIYFFESIPPSCKQGNLQLASVLYIHTFPH